MKAGPKFGIIAAALLLPCCTGLAVIGAFTDSPSGTANTTDGKPAAAEQLTDVVTTTPPAPAVPAETAGSSPAATTTSARAAAQPVVTRTVTETQKIAYPTRRVDDDSLAAGKTKVRTKGVAGVKTLTYEIVMTDGVQTRKKLLRSTVTKKPITKVIANGTKVAQESGCDSNYSGCVPIASDVDCAGGSGNGPEYVRGPVTVTGSDIYDLDRDGDGVACD
jgi:hypothetical protein